MRKRLVAKKVVAREITEGFNLYEQEQSEKAKEMRTEKQKQAEQAEAERIAREEELCWQEYYAQKEAEEKYYEELQAKYEEEQCMQQEEMEALVAKKNKSHGRAYRRKKTAAYKSKVGRNAVSASKNADKRMENDKKKFDTRQCVRANNLRKRAKKLNALKPHMLG